MKSVILNNLPLRLLNVIRMVGQRADQKGIDAYLVGGFVRDIMLGRENFDVDIVIQGDAIEFAKGFSQKGRTDLTAYPQFRTAMLRFADNLRLDLASARKETYPYPGALPVVSPGTIQEDLYRRDFTINALAVIINQKQWGCLIDDFKGADDLQKKIIRIFHPQSFTDDPTRILRAIRFEQRLGFRLAAQTQSLLEEAIACEAPKTVSPGRYFEEFKKIFFEQKCNRILKRLAEVKGLSFFHKDLTIQALNSDLLKAVERKIAWIQNHSKTDCDLTHWVIYFMALCDAWPLEEIVKILTILPVSKKDQRKIFSSKSQENILKILSNPEIKPSDAYKVLSFLSLEELVFFLAKIKERTIKKKIESFLKIDRHTTIETRGQDLMRAGISDGLRMRKILEDLLSKKIDGEIQTIQDEKEYLERLKN